MINYDMGSCKVAIVGNTIILKVGVGELEFQIDGVSKVTALCDGSVMASSNDIEGMAFQSEMIVRLFGGAEK